MNISTKCTEALITLYKITNRAGLLDSKLVRSMYVSAYFTYKKYLEDSYAKLAKYYGDLFKGGHILDVGANIGYTSFVFSKIIDSPFKIFAFEPEEKNIKILKEVSKKYNFSSPLVLVEAAVGENEGEIDLWKNEAHNGDHRILTDELKKKLKGKIKIQKTPLVTIDSYFKKLGASFPISFIKIDVQGYELAVCRGMTDTLAQNPNAVISFEYCPSITETLGFCPEDLFHFFQERGYYFYFLNSKNVIEAYDIKRNSYILRQASPHDYIDILCARRNLVVPA